MEMKMIPQNIIDELIGIYYIPEKEIVEDITTLFGGAIPPENAHVWDVIDWAVYFDS